MDATRRAALLVGMACALAYLILAVLAFQQHFFDLDHATVALMTTLREPRVKSLMEVVTGLGSGWALLPFSLVTFLWLRHRGRPIAKFVPPMVLGAYVVFALSKWIVGRPRPRMSAYGFPSAHTFGSVVFFGGLIYLLWTSEIGRVSRWTGTIALVLLIAGIAFSRLYLRSHWLSDVVGGLAGGAAYLVFFLLAVDRRPNPVAEPATTSAP
jgi:membrane-associated phospholipid phosphatase